MKLGVVGLPNVGKSTLFNAITNAGAESANYPFCTIEPNVGIVAVPDPRLEVLGKMHNTKKITPAVLEFVDIAGLVKGASKGEGLGNKFLSHIREVDAIVHVVRCFEDENIVHVGGKIDPVGDIETINTELILSDIESVAKRLDRAEKTAKSGDKNAIAEVELIKRVAAHLDGGRLIREMTLNENERIMLKGFFLLTAKPTIYAANVAEGDIGKTNKYVEAVKAHAAREGAEVIVVSARIEEELLQLSKEEREMFAAEMGLQMSGLDRLVAAGYKLLGLISYLTAGEKEVRAWTIERGTRAPQAAGKIHTDFEKGFIRAEVVKYADLVELGSMTAAKEKGRVASCGKDYEVQDGDVILFRFNV